MKILRDLLLILIGAVIGNALMSHAHDVDVGMGTCHHRGLEDGVWWQSQFGFIGNLKPHCFELQKNVKTSEHFGFSFGFADLGHLKANNVATVSDNDPYDGGPCNQATTHNCLARVRVDQTFYGITLGAFAQAKKFGATWGVETGLLAYRSSFNATITQNDYGQYSYEYNAVGYHAAPYLGIVIRAGDFFVRARAYRGIRGEGYQADGVQQPGLAHGSVTALTVGYTF